MPPVDEEPAAWRDHSLDAARGVLMLLGVALHAANIYATGSDWIVYDPVSNASAFGWIATIIHQFRMPAFFWISGFFFSMTLNKRGVRGVWQARLPRLVVPLAAAWLTLNVVQQWAVQRLTGESTGVVNGVGLYHLWFLVDLIVFSLLGLAITPLLPMMRGAARTSRWSGAGWVILASALISYLLELTVRATGLAYSPILGLTSLYRLASGFSFFVIGMAMYSLPVYRSSFVSAPPWLFVIGLSGSILATRYSNSTAGWLSEFWRLQTLIFVWASVAALLALFRKLFSGHSRLAREVSDSAYTIYLFHHLIVVVLGAWLLGLTWGPWSKYAVICFVTMLITYAIHRALIAKVPLLAFLFNGKPIRS